MNFIPLASSSHGNAYIVDDGATRILVECGVSFRRLKKMLGFNIASLDGCLISHEHKDHAHCHRDLIKSGVPVYASYGTAQALDCDLMEELEAKTPIAIGTLDVMPFETFHDAAQPLGFLIRSQRDGDKLVFATDTVKLAYHFVGVNIIAIECNYDNEILSRSTRIPEKVVKRIRNSHMEIMSTVAFLDGQDKSRCRQIWLLHLSDACADEFWFTDFMRRAYPGIDVKACPREVDV